MFWNSSCPKLKSVQFVLEKWQRMVFCAPKHCQTWLLVRRWWWFCFSLQCHVSKWMDTPCPRHKCLGWACNYCGSAVKTRQYITLILYQANEQPYQLKVLQFLWENDYKTSSRLQDLSRQGDGGQPRVWERREVQKVRAGGDTVHTGQQRQAQNTPAT